MDPLLEKKFEVFSNLSDEEGGMIIERYLLEGLESETLFEHELLSKFLFYPYPGREPIRRVFNAAIKRNIQRIGNLTVGGWLKKYIEIYENQERTPSTFFEFVRNNAETKILNKRDQIRLMRIFRLYDYFLVEPIFELDDIRMNVLKYPLYLNEEIPARPFDPIIIVGQNYKEKAPIKIVNAAVQEALLKYPNLGEQGVSSNPLKLRYFPNPVRPSIKNWITDFHDNMGAGKHGAIDRGNYLFHSENGRKLTPVERQKLSLIFKSLDENSPLAIDPEAQRIIFTEQTQNADRRNTNTQSHEAQSMKHEARSMNQEIGIRNRESEIANHESRIVNHESKFGIRNSAFGNYGNEEQKDIFEKYPSVSRQIKSYSPNFAKIPTTKIEASTEASRETAEPAGSVSFSSPQKLPVEQQPIAPKTFARPAVEQKPPIQKPVYQPEQPIDKIYNPHPQSGSQSQWQIRPKDFADENYEDTEPKTKGNIVDLRN